MTGRRYYLTTTVAFQRYLHRCAETHYLVLAKPEAQEGASVDCTAARERIVPGNDADLIVALVIADEAAHIALENDAEFEALPHPLSRTPISDRVAASLAAFGVVCGDDTFTVAEKLAHVNPLLQHRVF